MNKNDPRQKLIDDVIRNFDFARVAVAVAALDWQWQTAAEDGFEIPSIQRLKATARNLLQRSVKCGIAGTGGFEARYNPKVDEEDEAFILRFILCESDSTDY